ncbi:MAG TPA: hypothetical protein VMS21_01590 [Methylomirabilota bacterium]|nr:hypothetical protein [Methylomirabilota bacterium]
MNSHQSKQLSPRLLTLAALLVLALVPSAASGEIVFTGMEPSSGTAGTEVTLSSSGWGGTGAPVDE